jgi:hypothetical protein
MFVVAGSISYPALPFMATEEAINLNTITLQMSTDCKTVLLSCCPADKKKEHVDKKSNINFSCV